MEAVLAPRKGRGRLVLPDSLFLLLLLFHHFPWTVSVPVFVRASFPDVPGTLAVLYPCCHQSPVCCSSSILNTAEVWTQGRWAQARAWARAEREERV